MLNLARLLIGTGKRLHETLRFVLLFFVLLLSSVKANAGWSYNGICFPDDASTLAAFVSDYPVLSGGVRVQLVSTPTIANGAIQHQIFTYNYLTSASAFNYNVTYTLSSCTTPTNSVPAVVVGADSNTCFTKGSCNNNDVVNALTVEHDVIIYSVAVLLFFFGFHIGNGLMMGSIRRQS